MTRRLLFTVAVALLGCAADAEPPAVDVVRAIQRITPAALQAHVGFLASDLLEGRDTPSRGLELAAEYIAAQFRRAGLQPGPDGYFQTAELRVAAPRGGTGELTITADGKVLRVPPEAIAFSSREALSLTGVEIVKVELAQLESIAGMTAGALAEKAVFARLPNPPPQGLKERQQLGAAFTELMKRMAVLRPRLLLLLDASARAESGAPQLIDPEQPAPPAFEGPTIVRVSGEPLQELFRTLPAAATGATLNFKAPEVAMRPVKLRNVVGVLPGSDPRLKDTYVILSAHYDHLGQATISGAGSNGGDHIFNGANDDASGVAAVIEAASALASLAERPRRSIVVLGWFGEEKGLVGSRYYARRPLFPVEKTIAQLNLEQVGRTDDSEGARLAAANVTGFDYSTLVDVLKTAGEANGVRIEKHVQNSDAYFSRSDNQPLAALGVPAHTLSVAYAFPDYHAPGDHADKLDYENMSRIVRTVALAIHNVANDPSEPRWNESAPRAARYLNAWKSRRRE